VLNNACVAGDVVVTQGYTLSSIANALPSTGGTVTGATTFNSTVSINGANGSGYTGYKNRIINGGMVIDQRNNGASVTVLTTTIYTLDRWFFAVTQSSKFSCQQNAGSVTPPAGFSNYLGVTSLSSYSVLTGDYLGLIQNIEGLNVSDLAWGTASAATVTLSFWVRSSLTGAFGGALRNSDGTRSYPFTYTINTANTWEQKTITVSGETTGTWLKTNGLGLQVWLSLGAGATYSGTASAWTASNIVQPTGSTNVAGTNGATFYTTGVQLERGSNATSFEFRDYGRELMMCQRYYEISSSINTSLFWSGNTTSGVPYYFPVKYAVTKRANPTTTIANISNSGFPNTITVGEESITGFRADSTSNSTGSGNYYRANWTSSSEL
jgi:hypothetical protein